MYGFIDISQGPNFYLYLYCFLLYCFLVLVSLRGNMLLVDHPELYTGRRMLLFWGILLFALTSFVGGDFFHYYESMSLYKGQVLNDYGDGFEPFYQHIIHLVNGDYFLFRLIVWGGSLLLVVLSTVRFGANVYQTLFVILAGYVVTFSYARATLAMSVFTLGVVIVCTAVEWKKNILPMLVGLCILVSSVCFHRSMLPMMAIVSIWMLLPWKKTLTKYSVWIFPIFVFISYLALKSVFDSLFTMADSVNDETGTLERVELYSEQEEIESNFNGYLRLILHYSTFYIPLIILSNIFRSNEVIQKVDKQCIWLYQIVYLIFVFATSFLLLDIDTSTFFYRFLYMSFIPLSILIVYMKNRGLLSVKLYFWMLMCLVVSNVLQMFALVYSKI